jgi:hypothetical protein
LSLQQELSELAVREWEQFVHPVLEELLEWFEQEQAFAAEA